MTCRDPIVHPGYIWNEVEQKYSWRCIAYGVNGGGAFGPWFASQAEALEWLEQGAAS